MAATVASGSFSGLFAATEAGKKRYEIEYKFDLSSHKNKEAKLWIPLPSDIPSFQKITKIGYVSDGNEAFISTSNSYGAKTLFVSWDKATTKKTVTCKISAEVSDRESPAFGGFFEANDSKRFLSPTAHVPTSGLIAKISAKIVKNEKSAAKKARAVYDWVIANSYRDENIKGCGIGHPGKMLEQLEKSGKMGGKCLDMSALTVALMRAAGVAAREVAGVRLGASGLSAAFGSGEDITKAQHCKVEFFVPKKGWIGCDPADITKLILKEGLSRDSERVKALSEKFFGFWENNWLALNYARDFELYPKNNQGELDQFNYPYGEIDGEFLDFYSPKEFAYSISSKAVG